MPTWEETATPPQKRPYPDIDPKRTPATSPHCDGYPPEEATGQLTTRYLDGRGLATRGLGIGRKRTQQGSSTGKTTEGNQAVATPMNSKA